MIKNSGFLFLFLLILVSCHQDELPIEAHEIGEVREGLVNMMADYRYQVYFDLETNSVVRKTLKTDWDLGFESGADGWHIILNSSKAMGVKKMTESTFESIENDEEILWNWDSESGKIDSTAIANWQTTNGLYIVDRGYDYESQLVGLKKLEVIEVDNDSYSIRYANLDGSDENTFEIFKDNSVNFTSFSFENGGEIVENEPPKETWDLLFTQYLKFYSGTDLPDTYLVSGALQNRFLTEAVLDEGIGFSDFEYENIEETELSTDINTIGHAWKTFDFGTGIYFIHTENNYIIRTSDDSYFKLHFIDFYDDFGQKGAPKFEFQQL